MPTKLRAATLCLVVLWALPACSQEAPPASETPPAAPAAEVKTGKLEGPDKRIDGQYVRVRRDAKGKPVALETAVVQYRAKTGEFAGATVDLIGAIHVGERSYYDELNQRFTRYDALLFELVAPEGIQFEPGQRMESNSPISALQTGLQNLLGLEFQLERIDYAQKNFVHADMSPEEFARTMKERGESFFQMLLRMLGQSMAIQGQNPARVNDVELIFALIRRDRPALKRILAQQLEGMEGALNVLGGADGASTIITERNKKALLVMRRELKAGKKRIGIFYGAGHLPDMDERLRDEFGFERGETTWVVAWDLVNDHSPAARK